MADYFAVLGVGEKLTWKHSQKAEVNRIQSGTQSAPTEPNSNDPHPTNVDLEDERSLRARFEREIVDAFVVVRHGQDGDDGHHDEGKGETFDELAVRDEIMNDSDVPPNTVRIPKGIDTERDETDASGVDAKAEGSANHDGSTRTTIITNTALPSDVRMYNGRQIQSSAPARWNRDAMLRHGTTKVSANLNVTFGLRKEVRDLVKTKARPSKPVAEKLGNVRTALRDQVVRPLLQTGSFPSDSVSSARNRQRFFLAFRRRRPNEPMRPAIADVTLRYACIHTSTICTLNEAGSGNDADRSSVSLDVRSRLQSGARLAAQVAVAGQRHILERMRGAQNVIVEGNETESTYERIPAQTEDLLELPPGFDEWQIPEDYQQLLLPLSGGNNRVDGRDSSNMGSDERMESVKYPNVQNLLFVPTLLPLDPAHRRWAELNKEDYLVVPLLAIRRQRLGQEEEYLEDPAIVDMSVSCLDRYGSFVIPMDYDEDEDDDDDIPLLSQKTAWTSSRFHEQTPNREQRKQEQDMNQTGQDDGMLGVPVIFYRKNVPIGFANAAFATRVLDRFPRKDYKGVPLPEEELPMFCYPTGCKLYRGKLADAPLPQYYGFVIKNERGDNVYVSCVSFMEILTDSKAEQLRNISAHRWSARKQMSQIPPVDHDPDQNNVGSMRTTGSIQDRTEGHGMTLSPGGHGSGVLLGFDELVTFENKTICLVSRHPFWTGQRRFLSHLHLLLSASSSLPIERYISHLLLSLPLPTPGGKTVVMPLPALNSAAAFHLPHRKDLPLIDLEFRSLFACLDVPTIVTIILGFLALETKLIVLSKRPSLVLDCCELLRSLLFPFELCAPYVPRLTQPFVSCVSSDCF